jgi:hypothetical protein
MLTNSANKLDAYYCNGPQVDANEVPGRIGGPQSGVPYSNAYASSGGLCNAAGHCSMQANGDGAVSCVGNGTTWTHPLTVWRGQTFQAESATLAAGTQLRYCANCGNGTRVGYIGPTQTVTFKNVNAAVTGTGSLVVYYIDADPVTDPIRAFNVSVNNGPNQYRTFVPLGGTWADPGVIVGSINVALTGFVQGSANTIVFSGDGTHNAPDLDWIEIMPSTSGLMTPISATSSSSYSSSYSPQAAADGSSGTRWASSNNPNSEWIYLDFGSTRTINEVKINWDSTTYGKNYTIEVGNDHVNWTVIKTVTNGDGGTDDWTGLSASGRYVLMRGSAAANAYGYSINEMQVFGH